LRLRVDGGSHGYNGVRSAAGAGHGPAKIAGRAGAARGIPLSEAAGHRISGATRPLVELTGRAAPWLTCSSTRFRRQTGARYSDNA
jgi:hypothetical protein